MTRCDPSFNTSSGCVSTTSNSGWSSCQQGQQFCHGDISDPSDGGCWSGGGSLLDKLASLLGIKGLSKSGNSDASAAKTMNDFQRSALGGDRITSSQMDQMARCGTIKRNDGTTMPVPPDVQAAAQRFMANDQKLFKKMESATDGRHDRQLGTGDYQQALNKGVISQPFQSSSCHMPSPSSGFSGPCSLKDLLSGFKSEFSAAADMHKFQKSTLGGERITSCQMEQMERCGTITKKDGTTISVPRDVQASAQRFMANDGALFRKLESSTDGKCDNQLGLGDFAQAINKNRIKPF